MRIDSPNYTGRLLEDEQATIRIKPVDKNGNELIGAVVNHRCQYDGGEGVLYDVEARIDEETEVNRSGSVRRDYGRYGTTPDYVDDNDFSNYQSTTSYTYEFDGVGIHVQHFGNTVFETEGLTHEDFTEVEEGLFHKEVVVEQTYYPDEFTGIESVQWVGDQLAVVWEPNRKRPTNGYEISVAATEEALFRSDRSGLGPDGENVSYAEGDDGSVVGYTFTAKEARHRLIDKKPFMDQPFVAAVRVQGQSLGETNVQTAAAYQSLNYPDGTTIGSVSVTPDKTTLVTGDVVIAQTTVGGPGDPDPRVSFSTSGNVSLLKAGATRALLKADGNGEVTATSVADSSVSDTNSITASAYEESVGSPPQPKAVQATPMGREDASLVTWDDPGIEGATRIVFGSGEDTIVYDTTDTSYYITDLEYSVKEARLYHVGPDGRRGPGTGVELKAEDVSRQPAAFLTSTLPEVVISPGKAFVFDVSAYVQLNDNGQPATASDQSELWEEASVSIKQFESEPGISTSDTHLGGSSVFQIEGEPGLDAESASRDLLLMTVQLGDHDPTHLAVPVARGGSTGVSHARSVAGNPASWHGLASPEAAALCGGSAEGVLDSRWQPDLGKEAELMGGSVDDGRIALDHSPRGNMKPAVAAFRGDKGMSVICLTDTPPPAYGAKQLPTGGIAKVERPDGWVDFAPALLKGTASPERWRRALTESGELYNLSLFQPPEKIEFSPPVYFGDTWADKPQYPSDAQIDFESGVVRYRGGLKTPTAEPSDVSVDGLQLLPVPGGIDARWQVSVQGTNVTGAVALSVTSSGGDSFTISGDGKAEVRGLDPSQTYTVDLFGTTKDAQPLHDTPDLKIVAWRNEDLSYHYRYESDADVDTFIDGFGTEYPDPTFPIEKDGEDPSSEQQVRFRWSSGEEQSVRAPVNWQLPRETLETEVEQAVGTALPAGTIDTPTFVRPQYEGTKTFALPTNVYPAGTIRLEPEGYLPPGISGEIEDYVRLYFIGPDGKELGREVDLASQTELEARVEITAQNGQTPVFYGARVVRWTTN